MKHNILLVDENRELVESFLHEFRNQYECHTAGSMEKALDLIDESQFCAILADYHLASDRGVEFFQMVRRDFPNTMRIMFSDRPEVHMITEGINAGRIFAFLHKPVDMKELKETLEVAVAEYERLQKIQIDSLTDPLTGLYNRRFIERELQRFLEMARRHEGTFALIFGDVNSFKDVNDGYGHAIGDMLLKGIGEILTQTCRGSDLICRYGGDEFLILIETANNQQAERLIERINEAMSTLRIDRAGDMTFSLSLGQAAFPTDGTTVEGVLKVADCRMYEVKKHRSPSRLPT